MGYQVCTLVDLRVHGRGNGIENLLSMTYSGTSHAEVLAAGGQNNVLLLNIDRGTVVKQVRLFIRGESLMVGIDDGMVHETPEGEGDLCCDSTREYRSD